MQVFNYMILLWLSGLLIPYLYFYFLKNMHYLLLYLKKDIIIQVFSIFFIIQLLSTCISVIYLNFQEPFRYVGIFHNYFCFLFFGLGYSLSRYKKNFFLIFKENLDKIFWFTVIFSIISVGYFIITKKPFFYRGLISIFSGINNHYTLVKFVSIGYGLNSTIPRVQIFGIYSNTSAIFMYIIFTLYLTKISHRSLYLKILIACISLISIVTPFSRIVFICYFLFLILYFLNGKNNFLIIITIILLIFIFFNKELNEFIQFLLSFRSSSNNMRKEIYLTSLNLMMNNNFIFGLGLKPKIYTLGEFPVGSHSSLVGYFVKNGFLGGFFCLSFYIYFSIIFLITILKNKYKKKDKILFSIIGILIIYIFEDIDAYELTAFLTGLLFGCWKIKNIEVKFS